MADDIQATTNTLSVNDVDATLKGEKADEEYNLFEESGNNLHPRTRRGRSEET